MASVALCMLGAPAAALVAQKTAPSNLPSNPDVREIDENGVLMRFAVIGDYGDAGLAEWGVADLVHDFAPDLILTVGDNNYPSGQASTIDVNIGFFYSDFIAPYVGSFGQGASENRFFPSLGNHDWLTPGAQPYLDYFSLPGNERYYDVQRGEVHFFMLDSDSLEPDGIDQGSIQAAWLQSKLAASTAKYKLVFMHHAPFSSSLHGPTTALQWPFEAWGVDAVFAGHEHVYERLHVDGLPYLVNGLGGRPSIYNFRIPIAGSAFGYRSEHGALLAEVHANRIRLQFVNSEHLVLDDYALFRGDQTPPPEIVVPRAAVWSFLDDGTAPVGAWTSVGYDDAAWGSGPAELGFGEADEATTIDYGPDPNNKYVTTYLRHEFSVTDPAGVDRFSLALQIDDGAVVYLNGNEIGRHNMPAGVLDNSTLALARIFAAPERSFYGLELDPGLLNLGPNALAAEVHQNSVNSSDMSFAIQASVQRGIQVLVPKGSAWLYLDTGVDPGKQWMQPAFDDAGWLPGVGEFGYGDGDEATLVSYGGDPANKHISTYFRGEFEVPDPSLFQRLELGLLRDDGAIVYLNGKEVQRYALPRESVDHLQRAGHLVSGSDESRYWLNHINPGLLKPGTNHIAVEIHQFAPSSSDISFDLELLGW